MATLMVVLLMQYVISTKAGLVNHVQGETNVAVQRQVEAGAPIKTGSDGYVEVLLNPGSFLRIDQNSEVVLDSVELTRIAVRIVSGSAIVEAATTDKNSPITVTTGDLTVQIVQPGLYRFWEGTASVLNGRLKLPDSKTTIKKGWQFANTVGGPQKLKFPKAMPSALDLWSRNRSDQLARANALAYQSYRRGNSVIGADFWIYSTLLHAYTYLPLYPYRSPYGHSYYSVVTPSDYYSHRQAGETVATGASGQPSYSGGSTGSAGGAVSAMPSSIQDRREVLREIKGAPIPPPPM